MIIIKIVFRYFIEIAHTDDFPSTGTRLVCIIMSSITVYFMLYGLNSIFFIINVFSYANLRRIWTHLLHL